MLLKKNNKQTDFSKRNTFPKWHYFLDSVTTHDSTLKERSVVVAVVGINVSALTQDNKLNEEEARTLSCCHYF